MLGAVRLRVGSITYREAALHFARGSFSSGTVSRMYSTAVGGPHTPRTLSVGETVEALKQLTKFNLSAFVVSTACAGFALGSGDNIDWQKMAWTAVGTFGASGSASTLNQVIESGRDALMKRTQKRPMPTGAVSRASALLLAGGLAVGGIGCLYVQTNSTTALLGAANIGLYAFVYTPLKTITVANTWVGAVVGAVPPLMGWAAATGGLEPGAGVLAALLYYWQLPHFMALAYMYKGDYAAGGYRMLPNIDPTGRRVANVALRNSLYMVPLGLLACSLGVTTPPFAAETAAASLLMAGGALAFRSSPSQGTARRLFLLSLVHLPALQLMCCAHRVPNTLEARSFASSDTLEQWSARARALHAADRSPALHEVAGFSNAMAAPFPFLPLPGMLPRPSCPSRVACDAGREASHNDGHEGVGKRADAAAAGALNKAGVPLVVAQRTRS